MPDFAPRRPGILPILPLSELTRQTVKRECAGTDDLAIDDQGNEFERCAENDHGHLYFHGWCVHCNCEEP